MAAYERHNPIHALEVRSSSGYTCTIRVYSPTALRYSSSSKKARAR